MFRAVDVANIEQPSARSSRLKGLHTDQLLTSLALHARSASSSSDADVSLWSEKIQRRLVMLLEARQLPTVSQTVDLNSASVLLLSFSEALGTI